MISLMEMLTQGGNGAALDLIARQMKLTRAEAEKAAAALMPAFSQGLKRNVADPAAFMQFMASLASGSHSSYFDNPAQATSAAGRGDGDAILGHLFGSKEVSRAVAAQAAQLTGLSQSILKQMLPMLAPILLGGLFKQIMGGGGAARQADAGANPLGRILEQMMGGGAAGGGGANPWGQILEEMMRGGQPTGERGRHAPAGAENPFGRMLEEMLGGGSGSSPTGRRQPQSGDNPLGDIFGEMLRGGRQAEPEPAPRDYGRGENEAAEPRRRGSTFEAPPDGEPQPGTKSGLEDLFGKMFETGTAAQKDYQKGIEQIFDQFMGTKNRR